MKNAKNFWDNEYRNPTIFNLSVEPAEDMKKFTRWLDRTCGVGTFTKDTTVLDLGCGNGRNLIWLSRTFGVKGFGYDISSVAIGQAQNASNGLPLTFEVRTLSETIPLPDNSVDVVLDLMSSHYLNKAERDAYLKEVVRVLTPRGWLMFKSFLLEEDRHAARLLRDHPSGEENAYLHPRHGNYEYVWAEEKMRDFFDPYFEIEKVERSGKHLKEGKAFKRRHVVAYLSKKLG